MYATCCPAYTIRLKSDRFNLSKAQRQVVRRVERFLECGSVLQSKQEIYANDKSIIVNPTSDPTSHSEGAVVGTGGNEVEIGMSMNSKVRSPCHRMTVETTPAESTSERYKLYKKYQIAIHGDEPSKITETGFKRFLVDSPLFDTATALNKKEKFTIGIKEKEKVMYGLGTYHQLYRLDGRLVAVGVIDILPSGLSSVYLFYDPDEKQISLGRYFVEQSIRAFVRWWQY